jgi:hypothetical protein
MRWVIEYPVLDFSDHAPNNFLSYQRQNQAARTAIHWAGKYEQTEKKLYFPVKAKLYNRNSETLPKKGLR